MTDCWRNATSEDGYCTQHHRIRQQWKDAMTRPGSPWSDGRLIPPRKYREESS